LETRPSKRWSYVSAALLIILVVVTSSVLAIYFNLQLQNSLLEQRIENLQKQNSLLETKFETLQTNLESQLNEIQSMLKNLTSPVSNDSITIAGPRIYKLAEPSIVLILVEIPGGTAQGSGFIIDTAGHIVTNNHVVEDALDPNLLSVSFINGNITNAYVVGRDPYSDLAVIKVDLPSEMLKPLPIGNSSALKVGEPVFAIGNPFGLSGTITQGIVSQLGRSLTAPGNYTIVDVIQTDAAINPGNSGGPLLNLFGEVVGVNTAIASETGSFSGIGFAISSVLLMRVVPSLIEKGSYDHPWVGVRGTDVTPALAEELGLNESAGFLIDEVVTGSPAEKAGLKSGDVIIGIDGNQIRELDDLVSYTELKKNVGDTVTLTIVRNNTSQELELVLGSRPPP